MGCLHDKRQRHFIQNVYYMLAYAFEALQQTAFEHMHRSVCPCMICWALFL